MKINIASNEVIHFIGIGGIGMSGLAQIMKNMGFSVQGSDQNKNKNIERLNKSGIKVCIGHNQKNLKKATLVVTSSAIKKMDGTYTNLDFMYGVTYDTRNQVFKPTEGYIAKFTQVLPIVMDSSSIMNGFDASVYRPMTEDIIGAVKFYARTIHGLDNEDVRLTNRLFLPGKRLRGFNTRKVGPKDGEDWVGGNYTTAAGIEALLPNLLPESTRTDVSLFLDTGNVWSVDYNESLEDSNKIRSSVGITANVFTMIGPLSFTLAEDITKASTDLTETFNFRLGTSF